MARSVADPRRNFKQFWVRYLDAHRHPATRAWHYVATATGIICTVIGVVLNELSIAGAGIACGYVMAIGSHRLVERNKSLMGINPLFGYAADLRMCWYALTGTLQQEYIRLGLAPINQGKKAPFHGRSLIKH